MKIKHDYSYMDLGGSGNKMIEKGYAELDIHSINFSRHLTEEEMETNGEMAKILSSEEWSKRCEDGKMETNKHLIKTMDLLKEKYNIYNLTTDDYREDWDLFFSPRGSGDYFDYVKMNFNSRRSIEQNMKLLNKVLEIIKNIDNNYIACRVQYTTRNKEDRINQKVIEISEELLEKTIEYNGMKGKIKVIDEYKGIKSYGFFKLRARKKYYKIPDEYLILKYA